MNRWPTKPLKELCDPARSIAYGIVQPGRAFPGGVPIVRVNNFSATGLNLTEVLSVDPAIERQYARSRPQPSDVLVTLVGSIGQVAIAPANIAGWNLARAVGLLPMPDHHHAQWVAYSIRNVAAQEFIRQHANTTVQATFNLGDLAKLPIPYPDKAARQGIIEILTAIDDRIELNRRLNETLEGIAQAIFRDWFVEFGPVRRAQSGMTDAVEILGGLVPDPARAAELAALFPAVFGVDGLPEGWATVGFGEQFDLVMGQSPPGDTYNNTGDGLPFFQGRTDFGFRYPENRKFCSSPSRVAKADDTLISVRAPVGDINMAMELCCIGRGVACARHKGGATSYTFYTLCALQPELQLYEHTGTVFGAINRKQFENLPVVRSSDALVAAFESVAKFLDRRVKQTTLENKTLTETREYLLPRLMSGAVRIEIPTTGGEK